MGMGSSGPGSMRIGSLKRLGILVLSILAAANADAGAKQASGEDFARLQNDVARLNLQQQQILTALDEIKKKIRGPAPPELKPPQTINL
jgi:hypothetical protein